MKIWERGKEEKHIYSFPPPSRDQNINLSNIKILECEFLYCYKLMLRLHRVVVLKDRLGLS